MGRLVLVVDCCFFSAILSKTTLSLSKIGNASDLLAAMVRDDEICRPMEPKYISWEEKRAREDSIACNTHRLPWTRSDLSHCRFSLTADFRALRGSWIFSGTWMAVLRFLRADRPLPATVDDVGVVEKWRRVGMWLGKGTVD